MHLTENETTSQVCNQSTNSNFPGVNKQVKSVLQNNWASEKSSKAAKMIHIQVSDAECITPCSSNSRQRTFGTSDAVRLELLRKNRSQMELGQYQRDAPVEQPNQLTRH